MLIVMSLSKHSVPLRGSNQLHVASQDRLDMLVTIVRQEAQQRQVAHRELRELILNSSVVASEKRVALLEQENKELSHRLECCQGEVTTLKSMVGRPQIQRFSVMLNLSPSSKSCMVKQMI